MAAPSSYTPLEGDSLSSLGVTAPSFNGATPSFLATSTFLYTLCFVAIVGAAFYRYGLAGVLRMEASENTIRRSNDIIKQVTLGLLGVFSLFLILFTVNKGLVTGDVGLSDLKVSGGVSPSGTPTTANPPGAAAGSPTGGSEAIRSDPSVRSQLASIRISVNKAVCATPTSTGCTTVGGLPASTLSMLQSLRNGCGGDITITGGTEAGHKSHGPGLTPVDIRIGDSTLDSCIAKFNTGPSVGTWCKRTFTSFGYIFCDENSGEPHWHVYK